MEQFDSMSDAKAAVNAVYQADVGAIRTLADVATKLQTGGYTCPGDYTINGNLNFPGGNTLTSNGRFHISGSELLYILNKNGVIIGKEWGGNGNLSVQGTINSPNLNRLGAVNSEWLRINDGGSVGQTALYGALAINDTRGDAGGLCVGDWRTNVGKGNIHATGNITAGGNVKIGSWTIQDNGGNLEFVKDGFARVRVDPSGGFQLIGSDNNNNFKFSLEQPGIGRDWSGQRMSIINKHGNEMLNFYQAEVRDWQWSGDWSSSNAAPAIFSRAGKNASYLNVHDYGFYTTGGCGTAGHVGCNMQWALS